MPTARFRVTVNGFKCTTQTWDDALNWDGKADEVFIRTLVRYVNGNGKVVYENESQTPVMGDTWNLPGRVQVGNAWGGRGGIIDGDSYPTTTPWDRTNIPLLPARDYPPMAIWEGDLTQGEDVVVIIPTIWEWDSGQGALDGWLKWQVDVNDRFGKEAKRIVGMYGQIFDAVDLGIRTIATLQTGGVLGSAGSRPIGFQRNADGTTASFSARALVLDFDSAMLIASQQPIGRGNGVLSFVYDEDRYFRGNYTLYIQVEPVGVGGGPAGPGLSCSQIAANIRRLENEISLLQEQLDVLDPADPSEQRIIARLRAQIGQRRGLVNTLRKDATILGCP